MKNELTHISSSPDLDIEVLSLLKMQIHEKIRAIRQAKGYTQEYLAEQLEIDTVNYGRIERGQAKLTIDRLLKICELLEINPASLFKAEQTELVELNSTIQKIYKEVKTINEKLIF